MSITVSTDVFCDRCGDFVHGGTGPRVDTIRARKIAQSAGWKRLNVAPRGFVTWQDVCPSCLAGDV